MKKGKKGAALGKKGGIRKKRVRTFIWSPSLFNEKVSRHSTRQRKKKGGGKFLVEEKGTPPPEPERNSPREGSVTLVRSIKGRLVPGGIEKTIEKKKSIKKT